MPENRVGAASELPEYAAKKIDSPLALSGKLDDPRWQKAVAVKLNDAVTGEPGRFQTEVRVLYDSTYLYVGFRCEDDYVWGTVTDRDGPIWDEECVEVFINPANVAHQYYEINLSPNNVLFDGCVLNRRTAGKPTETFQPLMDYHVQGIQTAVHVDGELGERGKASGWTAEYAIPFAELVGAANVPPQPNDVWRINFYRIDSPERGQRESYAWGTTGTTAFHLPWKFGILHFE